MGKKNDKTNTKTTWNLIKFGGAMCLLSTTLVACGKATSQTSAHIAYKTEVKCEQSQELMKQAGEEAVINHMIEEHLLQEGAYNIKYSFAKDDKIIHIAQPTKETRIVDGKEETIMIAPQGYVLQTDEKGQTYAMKVTKATEKVEIVEPIKEVTIVNGEEKIIELAPAGYSLEIDETGKTIAKKVVKEELDKNINLSYRTDEKFTKLYYDVELQKWFEDYTMHFVTEEELQKKFSK